MSLSLLKILEEILAQKRLTILYQPIVDLRSNTIHGYEALARGPSDTPLHAPANLFETASRYDRAVELELLCQETAITQFLHLGLPGKLFLNVTPIMLLEPSYEERQWANLSRFQPVMPGQVVIELTEQQIVEDYRIMRAAIARCREMGYHVAMDDLGNGYAGLRAWAELRPDYIKIDRHFIDGLHEDNIKRQFVHTMHELAMGTGCQTIAEGIEIGDEYAVIQAMRITYGQGHYFARPHAQPPRAIDKRLFFARSGNGSHGRLTRFTDTVGSILRNTLAVEPTTTVENVGELFRNQIELQSVPVVSDGRPVGLIERNTFMQMFASRFGRDLYGRKPIVLFIRKQPVTVDKETPIEDVSRSITADATTPGCTDFIITDKGRYLGTGAIIDLLKRITELQVRAARHANPLTQLPGNVPIAEHIDHLLAEGLAFTVCYCDIDNFKPYNDCYGYGRGDNVIRMLATLLGEHVDPELDFVGHVGGDDFIVVMRSTDWAERCQGILDEFAKQRVRFYEQALLETGGIASTDRRGNAVFYPLFTLSIGAVSIIADRRIGSSHEVAGLASEAKSIAKKIEGNALFVDRRGHVAGGQPPAKLPAVVDETS